MPCCRAAQQQALGLLRGCIAGSGCIWNGKTRASLDSLCSRGLGPEGVFGGPPLPPHGGISCFCLKRSWGEPLQGGSDCDCGELTPQDETLSRPGLSSADGKLQVAARSAACTQGLVQGQDSGQGVTQVAQVHACGRHAGLPSLVVHLLIPRLRSGALELGCSVRDLSSMPCAVVQLLVVVRGVVWGGGGAPHGDAMGGSSAGLIDGSLGALPLQGLAVFQALAVLLACDTTR